MSSQTFDIKKYCTALLIQEPFFTALSRQIDKFPSTSVPTAGVRFNKRTRSFELVYNPDFFLSLNDTHQKGVLMHEYYHILLGHVTDRGPGGVKIGGYAGEKVTRLWNLATDLAINSFIEYSLPSTLCIPGRHPFEKYPKNLSAEQYYNMLKNDPKFEEIEIYIDANGDIVGDHSLWDKDENGNPLDAGDKEMIKEMIKNIVQKAVNECARQNSWGSISDELKKDILSRLTSFVNWKHVLRYFIKNSVRSNKSSSIKKINKRFPYIHAGKKVNRTANIAISEDQSGSVSDGMLMQFFTELNKLSELASFTVIPFDCSVAVEKIYVWKKGDRKKCERVLTGGTDFNAPTQYVNERNFDGHIILTDMCAPKPIDSRCRRIWLTTEDVASKPPFDTNEIIVPIPNLAD